MYYVYGIKLSGDDSKCADMHIVEKQLFISTQSGIDAESAENFSLGFAVQSDRTVSTSMGSFEDLDSAMDYVKGEYEVFDMPISSQLAGQHIVARYGVRELSSGNLATFDFSPEAFGGNPYKPAKMAEGCEILYLKDTGGTVLSQYLKAAILGQKGDALSPSDQDLESGLTALKEVGFEIEEHVHAGWKVKVIVGKEPKLV